MRSQTEWIDCGLFEILDGFTAEKLAADFVMGRRLALQNCDFASGRGKTKADHGAGKTASDDQMSCGSGRCGHYGFLRATQSLAGLKT